MTKGLLPVARFPLPENWEIEETTCVTFVIPDDPEYLAVITGIVDDLKWSKNFARDATGEGAAIVARTWSKALESQPVFTRGCDVPDFRIGPGCLLEVNCGTDDEPDWQPVFTAEHPEGEPETPYPEGTDEYEDNTARCITAANIAAQLKYGTETLANDAAIVGGIAIAIIDLLGAFLFFVPGGILIDIAIAILNLAVGHVAADFTDDLPDIDWVDVRDNLACFMERDGTITEDGKADFLAWMAGQYVGNLAWALTTIIIQNVDADGLTLDARVPQDEISIEDCPDCPWEHVIDFRAGEHGWFSITPPGESRPLGGYTAGEGWYGEQRDNAANAIEIYIQSTLFSPSMNLTEVEVLIEFIGANTDPNYIELQGVNVYGYFNYSTAIGMGEQTLGWTGSTLENLFRIAARTQNSSNFFIRQYTLRGVGTEPTWP